MSGRKIQDPRSKIQGSSKFQIPNRAANYPGALCLRLPWSLELGAWCFLSCLIQPTRAKNRRLDHARNLDVAKTVSLVSGKINGANRDALAKDMDLRDVVREVPALGRLERRSRRSPANCLESVQNVRFDNTQFQLHIGWQ